MALIPTLRTEIERFLLLIGDDIMPALRAEIDTLLLVSEHVDPPMRKQIALVRTLKELNQRCLDHLLRGLDG